MSPVALDVLRGNPPRSGVGGRDLLRTGGLDVGPVQAMSDFVDEAFAYAKRLPDGGDALSRVEARAHGANVVVREARPPMSHASRLTVGRDGAAGRRLSSLGDHVGRVVAIGAKKEVIGAHAGRVVAAMEHAEPVGDPTVGNRERNSMRLV